MTPAELAKGLDALRAYYGRDGVKHPMNDVQISVYSNALLPFDATAFQAACQQVMRELKWFPALCELLAILDPTPDPKAAAALAWSELEALTRRQSNSYRGVVFADPVMGEAVKRTFGTWARAVLMDQNDSQWQTRRNVFLSIYPSLLANPPHQDPVLLPGHVQDRALEPYVALATKTGTKALPPPDQSKAVMREVARRFSALTSSSPERER